MVKPNYGNSLSEIQGTILSLLEIDSSKEKLEITGYDNVENVVLIVVDAFGYNQWKNFNSGIFKEAEEVGELYKITSMFPSSTPVTLTSINTGLQPIQHSLLGWEMYYEEIDMKIQTLPFVDLDWNPIEDVVTQDFGAEMLFEGKSVYSTVQNQDLKTYAILQKEIAHEKYSEQIHGNGEVKSYLNIPDMSLKLRKLLNTVDGKNIIYAYMDEIDHICHDRAPKSEDEQIQLESISYNLKKELGKVRKNTAENTVVMFTADHGQIEISEKINVMKYEEVRSRLKKSRGKPITPSGSGRSVFLHVEEEVEELEEFLKENIDAEIYKTEEAVKEGFFGNREVGEKFYDRAGEILIIPNGRKHVWYGDVDKRGDHGGMHEDEMYVPLCVARLNDLQKH